MNFKILTPIAIAGVCAAIATEVAAIEAVAPNVSSRSYYAEDSLSENIPQSKYDITERYQSRYFCNPPRPCG
ncbi:MAG: hypothetical protein QNJ54_02175 [Prochloraceae cyanobacterium]|nr:hypothetical protein [Prochloraceae cyanobacterium]